MDLSHTKKEKKGGEGRMFTTPWFQKKKTHPLPYLFKVEILKRFVQAEEKKDACFSSRRSSAGEGGKIFFFFFVHPNTGRRISFYLFFQNIEMKVFFVCVGAGTEHSK